MGIRARAFAQFAGQRASAFGVAALGAALLTLAMTACGDTPQSILAPATRQARESNALLGFVFWAALGVFVVVEGVLLFALWRFRRRRGDALPRQTHGHAGLEIAWTIAPAALIAVVAALTFRSLFALAAPSAADAVRVRAIGHQWWFEFQYPDLGFVTANELHLPAGRDAAIQLESVDVIHSFWVPQLRGKTDMVPGRVNQLVFRPEAPGTYLGQCAEFCGGAHAQMKFTVVVEDPAGFDAWVALQKQEAALPASAAAQQGLQLFTTTGGCLACHTVRGTPAQGRIGPDLTHVGGRGHIAAGLMATAPDQIARWLRDPQGEKPGNKMTIRQLTEDEITALVAYLMGLK
ncbi:MAG: cytochrome c oxidase subunit II [Actinobacteria bacterium]|nr:cytochrome c oxidase subunit II [Actinomycetota bacterium]